MAEERSSDVVGIVSSSSNTTIAFGVASSSSTTSNSSIRNGCQRPRRPNPETIAYLKSLPLDVQVASEEVNQFLSRNNPQEDLPQTFSAALSAIDEIQNEIASLSGDEHGAQAVEVLARITCPYSEIAARTLLASTAGYCLHLATHRYGSHVLQTLIQLAAVSHNNPDGSPASSDLALREDAPPSLSASNEDETLPSLTELLVSILEELTPHVRDLAVHMCGSHVLRTLACVFGGVRMAQAGQGQFVRSVKKKKKKKHVQEDSSGKGGSNSDIVYEPNSRISCKDPAVQNALAELVSALSGTQVMPPGELQELVCHASAGPLLIVLLRVLTYRDATKERQRRLEKWDEQAASSGADHHLSKLRPEPKCEEGSEACNMAERILCRQGGQEEQLKWTSEVIYDLAGEVRGSHMLEALFRLSPDSLHASIVKAGDFCSKSTLQEYVEHNVSNFVVQSLLATARNPNQLREILNALGPLLSNGLVVDTSRKRRGILWRAVEAAAKYNVNQEELQTRLLDGFRSQQDETTQCKNLSDCVQLLLDMRMPEKHGSRLGLDVAGARTLNYLLRFQPQYCKDILKGILSLSITDLEMLAKDGLGSRCVWDGILDGPSIKDAIFTKAIKQLFSKLSGRWVALASDRIGHHSVKKIFRALDDMSDRKELVEELIRGRSRLNGCAMGRDVMEACCVQIYSDMGEKEWATTVMKMLHKAVWLKEIIENEPSHHSEKKQPKKRKGNGKTGDDSKTKTSGKSLSTVESIMDALTLPAHKKPRKR